MFFSRWTLFQGIIIKVLVVVAFIADTYKKDIAVPFSASTEVNTSMLMTFLFIVVIIGLLSFILYFQTKKSDTFLKHPLWDKMHILMPIIFVISLVLIFSIFLTEPMSTFAQNNRWVIYVLLYFTLFLINVLVLAFVHNAKKNMISNGSKSDFPLFGQR